MIEESSVTNPPLASAIAEELRSFASRLKRKLREQGNAGDLTQSQASVLVRLEKEGPMTTSAMARAEAMRPQSMGALLAALEAMGLTSGRPDPSDGRQTMISLTDSCRSLIEKGRAARQDWLTHTVETRLSPEEQKQLLSAMALLQRLVAQE